MEVIGPFGVGVWKYIWREWETFSKFVRFAVSDGSKVGLWHDVWCGEQPFKISYLHTYNITRCKCLDHPKVHRPQRKACEKTHINSCRTYFT
jgi:hypothetical protein